MDNLTKEKSNLMRMFFVLAAILIAYVAVKIVAEVKEYNFIGAGALAMNTISFEGKGEVSAVPDLATINFNITESDKVMESAQFKVTTKETAVLDFLKKSNIDDKDIKTENYNSYPKYEYQNSTCPTIQRYDSVTGGYMPTYCPPGKQILNGYEVSEYVTVKVHDTGKAGEIVKGLGSVGVSNISGPNFSIENEDILKEQVRKMAIDDAKNKAEILSNDLGVNLVRIVNFSENGNYPMMYSMGMAKAGSATSPSTPTPTLPTGENKITSNVTITYEIR